MTATTSSPDRRGPTAARRSLPVLALALLLGAGACSPGRPPAAVVDGQAISAQRVDDVVAAFAAADPAFREDIAGDGDDTYSTEWAADVLRILVTRVATARMAVDRRITVNDAHRSGAQAELGRSLVPGDEEKGAAVVAALPEGTRAWLVGLVAAEIAVRADVSADGPASPDVTRRYYDQNLGQFAQVCLSLLVVGPDDLDAARARLDAGEDFGDLSAELSVDPAVAEERGGRDCVPLGQLQQQLQAGPYEDIAARPEGGVVGPYQYDQEGNLVLVAVSAQEQLPFEEVADQLAAGLPPEARVSALLEHELGRIEVRVDPRFGSWDAAGRTVVPPAGPRPG